LQKLRLLPVLFMLGITTLVVGLANPLLGILSVRTHLIDLTSAQAANLEDTTIFMPSVTNRYPVENIFGVGMHNITSAGGLDALEMTHSSWVRKDGVRWNVVEPVKGERNWDVLNTLNNELLAAARANQRVILIVQGTPAWAAKDANSTCGPINEEEFSSFASFMHELVTRYSGYPYNIKNWEIWNEPDTAALDSVEGFGCWGDANDEYFGGGHYGRMLASVYPAIKSADPQSRVLVGGLLLDCHPELCIAPMQSDKPARFLEGILAAGGGGYFDGISFHAYDYYHDGSYWNPNWNTSQFSGGPVSIAKAAYIQDMLSKYGVSGKFLMNTESALICDNGCDAGFEMVKANYLVQAYAVAAAHNFEANLWYNMLGWRSSGLLQSNLTPREAYQTFKFASEKLGGATYSARLNIDNKLEGYEFRKSNRIIRVLWSKDGQSHPHNLTPYRMFDALGNQISESNIGPSPVYIELNL
jgi:hypothetical protein